MLKFSLLKLDNSIFKLVARKIFTASVIAFSANAVCRRQMELRAFNGGSRQRVGLCYPGILVSRNKKFEHCFKDIFDFRGEWVKHDSTIIQLINFLL